MNTKLTLAIEQTVIIKAKRYARRKGQSLSDIIENYLKVISNDGVKSELDIAPTVKLMRGSFKAPSDFDYKKELTKSLSKKYL